MSENVKVTKRDYFNMIINVVDAVAEMPASVLGERLSGVDFDSVIEFCENELATLAKRADKAKAAAAEKRAEGDALADAVAAVLSADFETIDAIVAKLNDDTATRGKVQYRLSQLAKNGAAVKGEKTVSDNGKNKKITVYKSAD